MRSIVLALSLCLIPGARISPLPVAHAAYVWQRAHGEAVTDAVARAPRELGSLVWLGGELDPRAKRPWTRVSLDAARTSGRPVGLAVRVHTLDETSFASDTAPPALVDALKDTAGRAREAGLALTELQLDFDCPTRKLSTYARWLEQLRAVGGDVPLTITALPSWVGAAGFERAVRATDGFVLQVHSLALPNTRGERARLFDDRAARAAVSRAAVVGVPFRVALPTHGYALSFDDAGRLSDVAAEEATTSDAAYDVTADPAEVAGFVRWLERARPVEVTGAIWFRLPTADDQRGLSMAGLATMIRGGVPRARLVTHAARDDDGAWSISVSNEGDAPATSGTARVHFKRGSLSAFDAPLGTATQDEDTVTFELSALAPHASRNVGWIRLAEDEQKVMIDAD